MIQEKKTVGEQAESAQNMLIEQGLSKVEKVPEGLGEQYCSECFDEIPMKRRISYGNGLCVSCASEKER